MAGGGAAPKPPLHQQLPSSWPEAPRAWTNTSGRGTQKAASLSCGRTDRQTACGRAGCQAWVLEPVSQSPSQSRGPLQNAECFAKQTEAAVLGACCWWLFTSFQRGFSHLSHPAPASPLTPYPTQLSWHRSSPGWAPQTTRDASTAGPQRAPTPCPRASHKLSNPRWQHLGRCWGPERHRAVPSVLAPHLLGSSLPRHQGHGEYRNGVGGPGTAWGDLAHGRSERCPTSCQPQQFPLQQPESPPCPPKCRRWQQRAVFHQNAGRASVLPAPSPAASFLHIHKQFKRLLSKRSTVEAQ